MNIPNEKLFYGAALWLLAERTDGVGISQASEDRHDHVFRISSGGIESWVLFKYRNSTGPWGFTISSDEGDRLTALAAAHGGERVFVAMVCRQDGVCCVAYSDLLDRTVTGEDLQNVTISVHRPPRGSYKVLVGRGKELPTKVARSDWPQVLFELKWSEAQ